jgi:arsenite-transporting ATPase
MDQVLALNALREYDKKGEYGVIIYDGTGDINTLRMLGISEILSWYVRRFRQVFTDSDLGRVLSPFFQPIASAILNTSFSVDNLTQDPDNPANDLLEEGKKVLADPKHLAAYLVTTEQPLAIAKAKYLWGSAQQSGIIVKGVLANQTPVTEALVGEFDPLPLTSVPQLLGADWEPLMDALPNFREVTEHLKPLTIDMAAREVRVFLPGLTKKQVKLTQYGPEITIEAGEQRRNIDLPGPLSGQPVKGAKFQNGYLIISF